ncbi:hypothetical protein [Frigoriglobus tundricola]|uniref:Uncharacterized protein n=1 Tax=Frigoriglobus tundricola TaxID=2774151 RepID=A0A6M5YRW1_9BACT|nr:hypothetical protein [Frigoriglobus tundricola]QJW96649.1 hypothetical protein FTUN_4206 [Frigoriglobus tundricola]
MRKRLAAVGLSVILGATGSTAQQPQFPQPAFPAQPPQGPPQPNFPMPLPQFPPQPRLPGQSPLPAQPPASMLPPPPATGLPNALGQPQQPQALPQSVLAPPNAPRPTSTPAAEVPLPQPEQKTAFSAMDVSVKRVVGGWQVWAGQRVLRDVGDNETNARDLARVYRDLRATEWVAIGGGPKPVVEYGLINGRPAVAGTPAPDAKPGTGATSFASGAWSGTGPPEPGAPAAYKGPVVTGAGAKFVQPIDIRTARVEPIRGVWCVRDDDTLLFNFGTDKAGAEQAVAVIRKYGFNRVGVVGAPEQPVMNYMYVSLEPERQKLLSGQLVMNAQIDALTRTGIPVPGVGYTGEMIKIDPRKVEARKNGSEWVVAAGPEVLGTFGVTEWAAREAARTVQDAKFTEYCKLGGTSGLTFFLRDGKAPTRVPFNAQGRNFDLTSLKVQQNNGKWVVTENNKYVFDVSGPQEGEVVIRVLKSYGFDQFAHLSAGSPKGGITFMVKNR